LTGEPLNRFTVEPGALRKKGSFNSGEDRTGGQINLTETMSLKISVEGKKEKAVKEDYLRKVSFPRNWQWSGGK